MDCEQVYTGIMDTNGEQAQAIFQSILMITLENVKLKRNYQGRTQRTK